MRGLEYRRFPYLLVFLLVVLAGQGCTRPFLQTYPASIEETITVSESFKKFQQATAKACGCCLDAEADASLSVSGWFSDHTGKLSGYLQAMEPGFIKFIGVNPLGQPMYIFVTDGRIFKSLNVYLKKAYLGTVESETFAQYAPLGFVPEYSYYWLTGRLQPGDAEIVDVNRSGEDGAYWLQIRQGSLKEDSMVLFDPGEQVILRHVLLDEQGGHPLDVHYRDFRVLSEAAENNSTGSMCRVPATLSVSSHEGKEKFELALYGFIEHPQFTVKDFQVSLPDSFELIPVN